MFKKMLYGLLKGLLRGLPLRFWNSQKIILRVTKRALAFGFRVLALEFRPHGGATAVRLSKAAASWKCPSGHAALANAHETRKLKI